MYIKNMFDIFFRGQGACISMSKTSGLPSAVPRVPSATGEVEDDADPFWDSWIYDICM